MPTELRTRKLPVKLTEEEIYEYGQRNAQAVRDLRELEKEKKAANADFKERIDEKNKEISELSECVNNREEWRQVELRDYRDQAACVVRTVRMDTDEVIATRAMTPQEKQGVFETMLDE